MSKLEQNHPVLTINPLSKEEAAEELDTLVELANQIPQVEYDGDEILADEKPDGRKLNGKWSHSYLAKVGGAVVGLAMGYVRDPDGSSNYLDKTLYISELAVNPDYQRSGVARQLVSRLMEDARGAMDSAGLPITLQTNSADFNSHVIKFYESLGFKIVGRKKYDNREDVVMRRETDQS